ncbi:MAG: hypothetical protein KAG14_00685, partial [Mycoplasmataceae bacterium]|nr:hypothetical protein [Mycoplasmataceae bacterium]
MKAILKGLIATGSIAVPAATTVGLVYGIKKEDTKLYFSPADTTGDKFFDSTIAPTSSNFASKMIINPPNGSPLNELVRLDQDLDYDRLLPLLKKDTITKKIKAPIKTWKVGFSLDKTVEQTNNKFKEINKWISKNILNKHEYHDDGEFIAGTDKKVRKSVGSSRVGIDIRKDLIKREVLVTLYDLVAEDAQTKNIADMFMKDIGGIDLSKIHFDPTNPEGFYEIFAGKLHLSYRYLNKYFKFKNVPPFYRQDLNGKLLPSYEISKFETKWGLNMSRVISNHYLGQKSYPGEEYEFAIFNSAKTPSTDAKVDEMISKFPKVSKKYAHGNPLRKDIKRRINFEHGIRVKNPKYSFESAFKFINPKTKAPITWDIKPIYDVNTGEIKLIFSFMELYKKLDSKGNIIESSSVEEDSTWEVKNYSNISRRIVSFNIKEIIKDKTHDKVPNKDTQTAVKILRDCLRGKFKEFVYNNLVNAGVKLMETLTPVLGTAMSDFEQIIKTLNSMKKSDDILTDEFVKSLLTQMEKDPFVDVNLFVKLMKEFDLKKWTSMEFLTNLDPHNGGQFNLFLLTTGWHSISDLILQEMKKKVPGIMIQYNGPIIKDLLKELKNLNLMGKSSGINDILKDPLDFGKKLLTKLVNKKVVLPETLLEKLIPMIPLKIIQKNAPKIQKALRIIIGDGSNLNKILSEIIESNKSLMDKLYKEWINEPGTSGRTKSDIDSNKKNELLLGWLLSPKAISIPLSSLTDENIVTVLVTTKFSADTFMVLGKAILASGIAPSFLNMIIPDTYPKAKEFSKLFTSGTAEEIFRAFQDVYINGLDKLTEPGAYHTDSEFVKKTKVLIHHILTEIKLDNLVTGLPSGIGHAVEPIISDTILPLIEKLLRTPIVQWPALFAPGTELAGVLDTLDLVLPKNIGDMISKFRKIIPVVGDLLNKGLKETIKPKNGGIDRLIDSFAMVADISKYKDLINGLLHGFHDYSTLKAVFDDVSPSIISTSLSAAGELGPDLLAHMVDGTSLGFLLGVAKGSIFHGTEYVVLSKLLKTGILSLSNSQLNVVTKMLSEFADRSIPIVGKLGELLPLKPEQLTLLKTLTVKKTGKLLSELLSKPIKDLTIESWKELLRIAASVTGINIPKNTGEAISKLLTHSITSFNPHNLRLILHSVISLTGLSSSEEVITKWALKILVGDYTLSHEKQFQDEKLLSEKQRFHTFDILPNKKSFSGSLPLGLVDEEATKNQINVLISRIEKMTDLDERGQEIARLTQKINKLKELKDAIVSANTEGDLLKAKLKNIQLMSTSINLPVVTPFKY